MGTYVVLGMCGGLADPGEAYAKEKVGGGRPPPLILERIMTPYQTLGIFEFSATLLVIGLLVAADNSKLRHIKTGLQATAFWVGVLAVLLAVMIPMLINWRN
jgi:hypothetical protein